MKIGIVDVGSNTVRIVVYNVENENVAVEIVNERYFVGLIEYVEKDVLTYEGTLKLIEALQSVKELIDVIKCDNVYCFGTAALRSIKNDEDVLFKVKKDVGFDINIISSQEEIFYDYAGIKKYIDEDFGVGLDLGGGSCQLFSFANDEIINSASMEIGSLITYKKFINGLLPNKKEIKEIKKYVKKQLSKNKDLKKLNYDKVYAIGGTTRAAAKLHRALVGGLGNVSDYKLTVKQIDEIIKTIYKMDVKGISFICHVIPERVYTIMPGLIILKAICKYVGIKEIKTVKGSVREGYLWEKIMTQDSSSTES